MSAAESTQLSHPHPHPHPHPHHHRLRRTTVRKQARRFSRPRPLNQLIVNEYEPGQGISAHIDAPCFGPAIATLSLGSACVMRFSNGDRHEDVWLDRRMCVVLTGPARSEWTHAIPTRKSDPRHGRRLARSRRLSLTFRRFDP